MTASEQYIAQKLRSKLSRALHALSEAKAAVQALRPELLEQLGTGDAVAAVTVAMSHTGKLRDALRKTVAAPAAAIRWEERSG